MDIWFALFILLSGALIYFQVWSLFILYKQKAAWKKFGEGRKLRYKSDSTMAPPELEGVYNDYTVHLFTGEHIAEDMRGSRKLTAIEVHVQSSFPVMGGVASGDMVNILKTLTVSDEFKPKHEGWDDSYVAVCENRNVMEAYLTPPRLEALTRLMKIKNAWIILIFKGDTTLLRLDTPEALADAKKLDKLVKGMVEAVKVLEFEPGEGARLKAEEAKKPKRQAEIKIADDEIDIGDLQLEDEGDGSSDEGDQSEEKPSTENS